MPKKVELEIGKSYGDLTVIGEGESFVQPSGQTQRGIVCKCKCGNTKTVRLSHLRHSRIKNCGCKKDYHKQVGTGLHTSWRAMRYRCSPDYFQSQYYYKKGIFVCKDWDRFSVFKDWAIENGYKKGLQIDRIDNSKGYFPDNCRWVTSHENNINRDCTMTVYYNGETIPFMKVIREKGLEKHSGTIRQRINRGWSDIAAIDTPIRNGNYK